jgi:hypothetical protein
VHFTSNPNLSDAITFRRNTDPITSYEGISRHTFSIFGEDNSIRFRDSRSLKCRRPDRHGKVRDLEITVWAAVELKYEQYEVVCNEERDSGTVWFTLLRLRPGQAFRVETSEKVVLPQPDHPTNPRHMSHSLLPLWSRRDEIAGMQYMAVVVRDYKTYRPWGLVLDKSLFGPVVSSGSAAAAAVGLVGTDEEEELLIDLEDPPALVTPPARTPGRAVDPGVGSSVVASPPAASPPVAKAPAEGDDDDEPFPAATKKRAASPFEDPFQTLYEGAKHTKLSGKGKGKERE